MNGAKEEGRSDVVVAVVADDFRNRVVVVAAGVVDTSEVAVISPRSPIAGCSEDYAVAAVAAAVVVACLDVIDTEDWDCCVPS